MIFPNLQPAQSGQNPQQQAASPRQLNKNFLKDGSTVTFAIFGFIGAAIIVISGFTAFNTFNFVQTALHGQGKIIDAASHRGSKGGITYAAVVEYKTQKDETITFTSKLSSSFKPVINTNVNVVYNPLNPNDATIDSPFDLWALPGFLGLFGLIFFLVGGIPLILKMKRKAVIDQLKMTGQKYVTKVSGIEYTNTRINKVPGKKVITEYSRGDNTINFKSDAYYVRNLENNVFPGDEIDVYINPADPQHYYVDVPNIRIKNG